MAKRAVVAGGGGFIGHHMVRYLKSQGYWVRGVDIKMPEYEASPADEFELLDLREWDNCLRATRGVDEVYQLAADMGGIGYITGNHAVGRPGTVSVAGSRPSKGRKAGPAMASVRQGNGRWQVRWRQDGVAPAGATSPRSGAVRRRRLPGVRAARRVR